MDSGQPADQLAPLFIGNSECRADEAPRGGREVTIPKVSRNGCGVLQVPHQRHPTVRSRVELSPHRPSRSRPLHIELHHLRSTGEKLADRYDRSVRGTSDGLGDVCRLTTPFLHIRCKAMRLEPGLGIAQFLLIPAKRGRRSACPGDSAEGLTRRACPHRTGDPTPQICTLAPTRTPPTANGPLQPHTDLLTIG